MKIKHYKDEKYNKWLDNPWAFKCYEYCPHKDDGGCGVCEKLGYKKPDKNCYKCDAFLNFGGEIQDNRYTCYPGICGLCKKDMGLIANPHNPICCWEN